MLTWIPHLPQLHCLNRHGEIPSRRAATHGRHPIHRPGSGALPGFRQGRQGPSSLGLSRGLRKLELCGMPAALARMSWGAGPAYECCRPPPSDVDGSVMPSELTKRTMWTVPFPTGSDLQDGLGERGFTVTRLNTYTTQPVRTPGQSTWRCPWQDTRLPQGPQRRRGLDLFPGQCCMLCVLSRPPSPPQVQDCDGDLLLEAQDAGVVSFGSPSAVKCVAGPSVA